MAGHASSDGIWRVPPSPQDHRELAKADTSDLTSPKAQRDLVREGAAKLYGQGFPRSRVARILIDHLVPNNRHRPLEQRLSQARSKLRRWEQDSQFRDMVYAKAVVDLDMSTPGILKGVASKAKRGRVDAARLALEITGRHNPKAESAPTQVAVVFQGIPRPGDSPKVLSQPDLEVEDADDAD